jgi:hypothetical protein
MSKAKQTTTKTTARILYRDVPRELIGLDGTFGPFFVAKIIGNALAPYYKAGAVVLVEQCDEVNEHDVHVFSEPGSDTFVVAFAAPTGRDTFEVSLCVGVLLAPPPSDLPPVHGRVHCEVADRHRLKGLVEWVRQQSLMPVAA